MSQIYDLTFEHDDLSHVEAVTNHHLDYQIATPTIKPWAVNPTTALLIQFQPLSQPPIILIPEPATWLLLASAVGLAWRRWRSLHRRAGRSASSDGRSANL